MDNFKIPKISSTTNKTIRFPNDVIDKVEKHIAGNQSTFSAFVISAVQWALDNLEENNKQNK